MSKRLQHWAIMPFLCLSLGAAAMPKAVFFPEKTIQKLPMNADAAVAHQWFDMFRTLTRNTAGFSPPVAARAFGYAGITLYETLVPSMWENQSIVPQLNGAPLKMPVLLNNEGNLDWEVAVNAAMADVAFYYYGEQNKNAAAIRSLENSFYNKSKADAQLLAKSKQWGKSVAKFIHEWSRTDGGLEGQLRNFPQAYVMPTDKKVWCPTFPDFQKPLLQNWGQNRTFLKNIVPYSRPKSPSPYDENPQSNFYKLAKEVYTTVKNITPEQLVIAKYWSDDAGILGGTPPAHSISITTQILQKENAGLGMAAETYVKVGIGISDAFVSCWHYKYQFNHLRPITYIRNLIDPQFLPPLSTPPFPEYTSGHSVQTGATARILSDIFGYNYAFSDNTHIKRTDIEGKPRKFKSFFAMANEAAMSRLYGGIHYREAIENGMTQGIRIGEMVSRLAFKKKM